MKRIFVALLTGGLLAIFPLSPAFAAPPAAALESP